MMKMALAVNRGQLSSILPSIAATFDEANPKSTYTAMCNEIGLQESFFGLDTQLLPRPECETNTEMLQLIPYVVVFKKDGDEVTMLGYQRGSGGNEERLHAKWSVGFGGHIEESPSEMISLQEVIADAAARELSEELGVDIVKNNTESFEQLVSTVYNSAYIIQDDGDSVGSVHLGLCFAIMFDALVDKEEIAKFTPEEGVIEKFHWLPTGPALMAKIADGTYKFESWSNMVIAGGPRLY